jgi:hypothetical protein
MRRLSVLALSLSLLTLGACSDSTAPGGNVLRYSGIIGSIQGEDGPVGYATVDLPLAAGDMDDLPALTCYVRNPNAPNAANRVWYAVSSSIADDSNCLLEPSGSGLAATLEGESIGWEYQFVVVY